MATTPVSCWTSTRRSESATESAIGISISTCFSERMHCSACLACTWVGLAMITASRSGCFKVSARSEVQCGMCHFSATVWVPAGRPPVIEMTSTSAMLRKASRWRTPKAPCPTSPIFMLLPDYPAGAYRYETTMFQDLHVVDFHAHFPIKGDVSTSGIGVRQHAAGTPAADQATYMLAQAE